TYRPTVPIVAATAEIDTWRQLALVWGTIAVLTPHANDYDTLLNYGREQVLSRGLVRPGERVVVTAGVPFDVPGTTNLLKIEAL
ncbi:MAG TPA: pyruvate kinase alpha/beta domain-containing protein, partial [Gemmatimonadales bacterium]|nr:pyruvate kinase alpha/beta domain-containing protein [Gemmatimonadales bacterium]